MGKHTLAASQTLTTTGFRNAGSEGGGGVTGGALPGIAGTSSFSGMPIGLPRSQKKQNMRTLWGGAHEHARVLRMHLRAF